MIPFSFSYFFISLLLLLIGSYTDFKERIVSNKLTYGAISLGLLIHAIESFYSNDYFILGIAVAVTIATFIASYGLWKLGVWAGGDVKLFTALAALNPFNLGFIREILGLKFALLSSISIPIFPLTLFIYSIFSMLPYGAILSFNVIKKRNDLRKELIEDMKKRLIQSIKLIALITGLNYVLVNVLLINNSIFLFVIVIVSLILSAKLNAKIRIPLILVLFGYAVYFDLQNSFQNFFTGVFFVYLLYVLLKLFSFSRKYALRKKIKVNELEEGMIPAVSFYEVEGKIIEKKALETGKIINNLRNNNLEALLQELRPKGKEIVSMRKAAGLEEKEIIELKKLAKEKKIPEEIEIKLTAPMVPAVLIAYVLVNITGDLIWNIL
ncbi:A24 family peptidase [Candidatus Micrarchaeota archaeon]|nr:A24 family peptidase [Candidatus Micrarchaeota archaeon]